MAEKIDKYELVEPIGRGGMGAIFKAYDPVLDRLVALKMISSDTAVPGDLRARFLREAQACALLSHPNIVTVYAMGEDKGQPFIVMELLEGEDLKGIIARRAGLALEDKLAIMAQVCAGLAYAHRMGIVHRDIKPSNIFLTHSGWAKILDFGIAQMAGAESVLTRAGSVMGSLRYASPEQLRGRVDHRSDMFSVGSVFYELLSTRPAFSGDDPMQFLDRLCTEDPPALDQLDPRIPPALAAVIARAMRKEPAERFPDLDRMRLELETVRQDLLEETRRELSGRQRGRLVEVREVWPEQQPAPTPDRKLAGALDKPGGARTSETTRRPLRTDAGESTAPPTAAWRYGLLPPEAPRSPRRVGVGAVAAGAAGALAVTALGAFLWLHPAPLSVLGVKASAKGDQRESREATVAPPADRAAATRKRVAQRPSERPEAAKPVAAPRAEPAVVPPAEPAAPHATARPLTPRQAVSEVFEARNGAHSVIASVIRDTGRRGQDRVRLRIVSSRPGYAYVMAIRGIGSSDGADVELLFPSSAHTGNRIEPGQPLTLPAPRSPVKAERPAGANEFLAIVSDEPRDFDGFRPAARGPFRRLRLDGTMTGGAAPASNPLFGGTIACVAAPPCSDSYGAVVFTIDAVQPGPDAVRTAGQAPATALPAAPTPRHSSPRCSGLLERASLGEALTSEEQAVLTRDCQ